MRVKTLHINGGTDMSIENRPNHATHIMTAAEARGILRDMEAQVKSAAKRKRIASLFATNIACKLSVEAVAVYKAYSEDK
jgi:hypothetical protein